MTTKYTRGPWSVDTCCTDLVTADCDGLVVASADTEDRNDEEVDANARLIASAPDLAEALVRCMSHISANAKNANYPRTREAYEMARAALVKAGMAE